MTTTLSDELRALLGLIKFHRQAGTVALQAAKTLYSHQNQLNISQQTQQSQQPQQTQQSTDKLIVRIPIPPAPQSRFSSDPKYVSDYGYRGMKPYEQCNLCNRKFQIQPNGFFGKAHNRYCPGVPRAIRKLRKTRIERSGG
jgi:hypothetical protein